MLQEKRQDLDTPRPTPAPLRSTLDRSDGSATVALSGAILDQNA
jgi:hypothetical protein